MPQEKAKKDEIIRKINEILYFKSKHYKFVYIYIVYKCIKKCSFAFRYIYIYSSSIGDDAHGNNTEIIYTKKKKKKKKYRITSLPNIIYLKRNLFNATVCILNTELVYIISHIYMLYNIVHRPLLRHVFIHVYVFY